jgi:hypothetical protein
MSRREDLEDILADPSYFQAIFHTLSNVNELYQNQTELGLANETIASELALNARASSVWSHARILTRPEPGFAR